MITLERLGTLDVSAASGAVLHDRLVHVVADDGLFLHAYALDGTPKTARRLFAGTLPEDARARKKVKPDLEALAILPDGSFLAIGSGSTEHRRRGALVRGESVREIDLAPLYAHLAGLFDELNVEGLTVHGAALVLAQRGNGKKRENALVRLDLGRALAELDRGSLTAASMLDSIALDLGTLEGVPLSITDLASHHGRLFFSAAAEDTDDPYLDAPCAGSVVGELGDLTEAGRVAWFEVVSPTVKIEGLAADGAEVGEVPDAGLSFVLVADADDPTLMAPLFRGRFVRP